MTISNDNNKSNVHAKIKHHDKQSTSRQIIKHIKKLETPMQDVRDLMLNIATQYQQADKVGYALGLFDKSRSFIDNVSWCSIVATMDHGKDSLTKTNKEHLTELVDNLDSLVSGFKDDIIDKIQHYRDKWMLNVLMWDFIVLAVLSVAVYYGIYSMGLAFDKQAMYSFVQMRPIFTSSLILSTFFLVFALHFVIRQIVLRNMLNALDDDLPEGMSLTTSLEQNSHSIYSIFRPTPVGWNILQSNRIKSIVEYMDDLREQLSVVQSQYKS